MHSDYVQCSCGTTHTCALSIVKCFNDDHVLACASGCLRATGNVDCFVSRKLPLCSQPALVVAGRQHVCSPRFLQCSLRQNSNGQLNVPVGVANCTWVAAGDQITFALMQNGVPITCAYGQPLVFLKPVVMVCRGLVSARCG